MGITLITIGESTQSRDYGDGEKDNVAVQTTNGGKEIKIILNWDKK